MEQEISTTHAVEEWRPIAGYDDLYEVSNLGRVRSLDRVVCQLYPNGNMQNKMYVGKVRCPEANHNGYMAIQLYNGKKRRFLIHRLVAMAFIPNPNNLPEVNHKDEDKLNNRADNLEWCDGKYNSNFGTGKWRKTTVRKKRVEQLTLDGRHVDYFDGAREAERLTGYRQANVSAVCRGEKEKAYGYKWKYIE